MMFAVEAVQTKGRVGVAGVEVVEGWGAAQGRPGTRCPAGAGT
jgi:hypothetical protein